MPTRPDKGQTEKQGSGKTGGQKAAYGSARSPEVAEGAGRGPMARGRRSRRR